MQPLPASPLVSIVTPSFQQGRFIEETIRSVAAQDYPHLEHVVVDGGSTDGTLDILRRHSAVRWISEPDHGQSEALNKGFALARGEVVGWLNSDDVYLPGAVSKAVDALARSRAAMVFANLVEIDENGCELGRQKARRPDQRRQLAGRNAIPQPTVFLRREALEAVGGVDPDYHYAMDYELWLRIGARFPVEYIDDWWAAFRRHPASKTDGGSNARFWKEVWRASRRNGGPKLLSDAAFEAIRADHPLLGALVFRLRRTLHLAQGGELGAIARDAATIPARAAEALRRR